MKKNHLFKASFWRALSFGIEEIILFCIIVLNIFDAIEFLPPDLDYVKKIISWAALGYILYQTRPSRIITGSDHQTLDIILISGYFLLIIKNLISYAASVFENASDFLQPFYSMLITNASSIERGGIYIGLFLLVVVATRYALTVKFERPSVMQLFHKDRLDNSTPHNILLRFLFSFLIIMAFFVIIFNLFMEWLAIAIDAPLLMIGLGVYFFFIFKHRNRFSPDSFLFRFGDFGESFYKGLFEHLKTFRGSLRVLSAMIVLHVFTDAFTFIWPYLLGRADALYFNMIPTTHPFLKDLFLSQISGSGLFSSVTIGIGYLGNLIAILFLLLAPVGMWFLLYYDRHINLKRSVLSIIFGSLALFLLTPGFSISRLSSNGIYGVDIIGHPLASSTLLGLTASIILAFCCTLVVFFISRHVRLRQFMTNILIIASQLFLIYYIILFAWSVGEFYITTIPIVFSSGMMVIGMFLSVVAVLTASFYIVGLGGYLVDVFRHLRRHVNIGD